MLRPFDLPKLFTKTEFLYDCTVALNVLLLEVTEKVSSVTDHLKHTAAAVMVLGVSLEVLGEVVDSLGENSDLNLGRTGVALVSSIGGDDFLLNVFKHHDKVLSESAKARFHLVKYLPQTKPRWEKMYRFGTYVL